MRGSRSYWLFLLLAVLALLLAACGQVSTPAPLAEDEVEDQNFGSSWDDYGKDVAVDSSGNVYVTGATRCGSPDGCYAYIRKYDANNKLLWKTSFRIGVAGQKRDTSATSVSVDGNGNAFVVGDYHTGDGAYGRVFAGFIRKYSTNGSHLWTRLFAHDVFSLAGGRVLGSAVDGSGNLYVVGVDTDGEESHVGFIHKYSSSGSKLWTRTVSYDNEAAIRAVAVGPKGGVVVVGSFLSYDDSSERNGFVAKYLPDGTLDYEHRLGVGDGYNDDIRSVTIDGSGNIYVAGTKSNSSAQAAFLRKLNSRGSQLWSKVIWGSKRSGHDVAVDANGNVYLAGTYRYSGSDYDTFVTKYSASGSKLWTTGKDSRWHPKTYEPDVAIATRTGNPIYLIGSTQGKVGPDRYGGWDAYLVRLNGSGKFVWAD
jgi:hypothetical protein